MLHLVVLPRTTGMTYDGDEMAVIPAMPKGFLDNSTGEIPPFLDLRIVKLERFDINLVLPLQQFDSPLWFERRATLLLSVWICHPSVGSFGLFEAFQTKRRQLFTMPACPAGSILRSTRPSWWRI